MDVARETARAKRDGAFASRWIALALACAIFLLGLSFPEQGDLTVKYIFGLAGLLSALVVVEQIAPKAGSPAWRQLLGGDSTNRELAQTLSMTEQIVKNYISSILARIGMRDRTRVALFALRQGTGEA